MHPLEDLRPNSSKKLLLSDMDLDGHGTSRAKPAKTGNTLRYLRVLLDAGTRMEQKGGSDLLSGAPCC